MYPNSNKSPKLTTLAVNCHICKSLNATITHSPAAICIILVLMSAKERRDDSFIKKPIYPGGTAALRKFIKENLKYPKEALEHKTEGTVFVRYTVDHKGKVTETKVVKGIGHGCDKEAERIIKLLQFEIPKNPRKLRVTFHKKTQITFKLPKQKSAPSPARPQRPVTASGTATTPTAVRYVYVAEKKAQTKPSPQKRTYSYTIGINTKK